MNNNKSTPGLIICRRLEEPSVVLLWAYANLAFTLTPIVLKVVLDKGEWQLKHRSTRIPVQDSKMKGFYHATTKVNAP